MPLFPPPAPVTVLVDGRPLRAYERAYVSGGRIFAPVAPLLTELADRLSFEGDVLVIERGGRLARVRVGPAASNQLDAAYVPIGPALRALGASARYEPATHRLFVSTAAPVVGSPTPFNAASPGETPSAVFTPIPATPPRPIWTGSPAPRRTALPFPPPRVRAR